ncbi:MAG: hypothetical protein R2867_17560 [Caldilineaceae bacterium]
MTTEKPITCMSFVLKQLRKSADKERHNTAFLPVYDRVKCAAEAQKPVAKNRPIVRSLVHYIVLTRRIVKQSISSEVKVSVCTISADEP